MYGARSDCDSYSPVAAKDKKIQSKVTEDNAAFSVFGGEVIMYKNAVLDFFLFFALPAFAYIFAGEFGVLSTNVLRGLMIALATTGVAYIASFALSGNYDALKLQQRFGVMAPAFIFASTYWLVLIVSRIADGYGEGNILALLFGLTIAGTITLRRAQVNNNNMI